MIRIPASRISSSSISSSVPLPPPNISLNTLSNRSVPGFWIAEGDNEVYVNSDLTGGDLTLGDWWGDALSEVAGKRLSELMWSVKPADTEAGAVYFDYDVMDL